MIIQTLERVQGLFVERVVGKQKSQTIHIAARSFVVCNKLWMLPLKAKELLCFQIIVAPTDFPTVLFPHSTTIPSKDAYSFGMACLSYLSWHRPCGKMEMNMGFGDTRASFPHHICPFLWTVGNFSNSLSLGFLVCKLGILIHQFHRVIAEMEWDLG